MNKSINKVMMLFNGSKSDAYKDAMVSRIDGLEEQFMVLNERGIGAAHNFLKSVKENLDTAYFITVEYSDTIKEDTAFHLELDENAKKLCSNFKMVKQKTMYTSTNVNTSVYIVISSGSKYTPEKLADLVVTTFCSPLLLSKIRRASQKRQMYKVMARNVLILSTPDKDEAFTMCDKTHMGCVKDEEGNIIHRSTLTKVHPNTAIDKVLPDTPPIKRVRMVQPKDIQKIPKKMTLK
ncbi:hypothetical protein [Bacteroides acidifaciens]|uniref:hypothetical protein n=1 Tax=Bacteroides acidifaciens TaxID=85831 RepID=UPI00263B9CF1|nr:hypothetical protein [Bacteroides acidifaciens]